MILPCTCPNAYQDALYGRGRRVHNPSGKTRGAARCVESSSNSVLGGILLGQPEGIDDNTYLLPYTTALILSALRVKAEAGIVPMDEYQNVHEKAFSGEWGNIKVRQAVHELSEGRRLLGPGTDDSPDDAACRTLYNGIAEATAKLKALKGAIRGGRVGVEAGNALVDEITRFLAAFANVFGPERLDADRGADGEARSVGDGSGRARENGAVGVGTLAEAVRH